MGKRPSDIPYHAAGIIHEVLLLTARTNIALRGALFLLFSFGIAATLPPFSMSMPTDGLDPSWALGMSVALGERWIMGKDIIFTYGPYSFVYTNVYYPGIAFINAISKIYLIFSILFSAYIACRNRTIIPFVFFAFYCIGTIPELIFQVIPFFIFLAFMRVIDDPQIYSPVIKKCFVITVFPSLAMLMLVKGTFFALSFGTVGAAILYALAARKTAYAALVAGISAVSLPLLWMASGQALADLPHYFMQLDIISGYSQAMSIDSASHIKFIEIAVYIIASILISCSLFMQKKSLPAKIIVFIYASIFFWITFKSYFVRHDGHGVFGAVFISMISIILYHDMHKKIFILALGLSLYVFAQGSIYHNLLVVFNMHGRAYATSKSFIKSICNESLKSIIYEDSLKAKYADQLAALSSNTPLPLLDGTSDIYPIDISRLIASGNKWNPRPTFQSYSAYTPRLAAINLEHISGGKRPDNIFFSLKPIDGRYPTLEDGPSWPTLLRNYAPASIHGEFAVLRHKVGKTGEAPLALLQKERAAMAVPFAVRQTAPLLFTRIVVQPDLRGKVYNFLFKPRQIHLEVTLANGEVRTHRFIPNMGESLFLLSPYVDNIQDFQRLYGHEDNGGGGNGKRVVSLRMLAPKKNSGWEEAYDIELYAMQETPPGLE